LKIIPNARAAQTAPSHNHFWKCFAKMGPPLCPSAVMGGHYQSRRWPRQPFVGAVLDRDMGHTKKSNGMHRAAFGA